MVLAQDYWSSVFDSDTYFSTSTQRTKLWDPIKTLGIINTDPGYQRITCNGYAPSQGRRCRNPINQGNRAFINSTLEEIAYLDPRKPEVLSRLRSIAGSALCVRYHQGQSEDLVRQWQQKIRTLPPVARIGGGGSKMGDFGGVKGETSRKVKREVKIEVKIEDVAEERNWQEMQRELREMREMIANLQGKLKEQNEDRDSGYGGSLGSTDRHREEQQRLRRREEKEREEKRKEQERLEKEREEREEQERIRRKEEEEKEAQRKEKERVETEKREKEERERRRKEEAAEQNERIRQRAQKRREEAERQWTDAWAKYQDRWTTFKTSTSTETRLRESMPWPVKSGLYKDVKASDVREFLGKSIPKGEDKARVLRKECRKWHPDMIRRLPRAGEITEVEEMMCDMICRIVTDMLNCCAGRSDEYIG